MSGALKNTAQFDADDGLAVGALQERDGFDLKALFGNVGEQHEDIVRVLRQIGRELLVPGFIGGERAFLVEMARLATGWQPSAGQ